MWIYFVIMAGVVVLDQATKHIVLQTLKTEGNFVDIIPGVFRFKYIKNDGAAFGMLDNARWVFILLTIVTVAAILYYLIKHRPKNPWLFAPLSMIVGGGIGNMIDRLFYCDPGDSFGNGQVVDFIDFYAFPRLWQWVFNVADSFVVVSAFILFGYLLLEIIKEGKAEKAKAVAEAENTDVAEAVATAEIAEETETVTAEITETSEPSDKTENADVADEDHEG